ncbi:MAG: oligosaccharide flippase family protein [Bacteroidales bacterium]|nr:oligosaccharide flippase family protein [Bacteroidales bacterium]
MKNNSDSSNTTQAIWVGIGQLSSFSLSIINAAILARYFDKAEYGTYKQILYIYNILLVLFSAGLHGAPSYFLPRQTMEQGKDFIFRLIRVFILLGFSFSLSLFLLAPVIADLFNNPDLTKGLRLFSITPMLMLPTNGLEGVYASLRKTRVIAIYTTATRIFTLILITFPVIILKGTYITAIYGWIISSVLTCILAIYLILRPYKDTLRHTTKFGYRDIFKYSLPLMVATVYGILIRFADQFFISRYYGTEVFAEFSNGFIDLPFVSMMIGATTTVLLPLFSRYSESASGTGNICQTWKSATEKSVILIYPVLAFFIFNSKSSVIALYGEQYAISASYFMIGMLIGFFNIIVYNPVLFSMGKTRLYANMHLIQVALIWITGYAVVFLSGTPILYASLSRLLTIAQVCVGILFATRILGIKLKDIIPFNIMLRALLHSSLICGIVAWLVGLLNLNVFIRLGLSGLISAGIVLFTGGLFGIHYLATLKSMLVNIPGFSYMQNMFERMRFLR